MSKQLTCKRCGQAIDQETIDWFARKRPGEPPRVCVRCLIIAIDTSFVAGGLEPIFPETWKVIKPGANK